ncbi:MAG: DUF2520 domain-containing protein [Acidobacteriota bacterium]|nr:DUF2520 domain-containing protein [Acidobacteriota bacterium]
MKIKNKFSISIIGAGRLGGALAIALAGKDYKIAALVARRFENAERAGHQISSSQTEILTAENLAALPNSDIVFITTPDPEIEPTAARLAASPNFNSETIFLHTSGSLSSTVLSQLKDGGASVGSLHPLVSVSDSLAGAERFAGAFFCVEGDTKAVQAANQIVADLGGEAFEINPDFKILYHAAAVMTAGHLVALFDVAAETLTACGIEEREARRILLPLAQSGVENLGRQTPAAALTGTFARADIGTMRRHLESLRAHETALRIYAELGKRSVELARKQGADAERLEEMRQILVNRKT